MEQEDSKWATPRKPTHKTGARTTNNTLLLRKDTCRQPDTAIENKTYTETMSKLNRQRDIF